VTSAADPTGDDLTPLTSIEPVSVVTVVTRRLLHYFTSGHIERGGRLPSERRLAESLGVGRSAVREALAALELLGVVSVRPGSGTYLKSSASELLPQTLSWGVLLDEPRTRELIDVRHALEVEAARSAATAATPAALAELEATVAAMAQHGHDFPAFVEADMRFHQLLAAGTGNVTLADLLTTLRSLLRVWVERAVADGEHTSLTLREHTAVLDAVRSRDPVAAAAAMDRHMASARGRLVESLGDDGPPRP
jgi:GntR family transcriptional repressor for pyruvate dehydrogenase complex